MMVASICDRSLLPALILVAVIVSAVSPGHSTEISEETFLNIEVDSDGDLGQTSVYLALVAEDQPWGKPLLETVLRPGVTTVSRQVAPGHYHLVYGAPGHRLEYSDPLVLPAGEHTGLKLRLKRLQTLRGRLLTAAGEPVAGARIGHLRAFVDDFTRRLSPLGEDHLRANFAVRSDAEGRFALPAQAGLRHFVWTQAEGFAPSPLRDVLLTEDSQDFELRLRPGASLSVSLAGSDAAPQRGRLQLVPATGGSPEALMVWERGLPAAELHWPALPPGDYTLRLQGPRWSNDRQPATVLATLTLPAGARRALRVELPAAPEAAAGAIRGVRLFARRSRPTELRDFTLRRWLGEESRSAPATLTAVSGGTVVEVPAGCEAGAHYLLTADRSVASARLDGADACRRSLDLTLFPRAELTGQILAPDDRLLPAAGRLRLDRCPRDPSSPANPLLEIPFSVRSQGRFAGPAASGCVRVSLQIGDFPTLALAEVELKRGQTLDLGRHRLEYGGTLLAQVVSAADGRPLDDVEVQVVEAEAAEAVVIAAYQRQPYRALQEQLTRDGGWSRFPVLPAGTYNLLLRPEHQRWPRLSRAFEIRPHEQTVLEGVIMPSPSSLTVETVTARRLEEELSSLEVNAHSGDPDSPEDQGVTLTEQVGEHGLVAFSEIPPGTWWLQAVAYLRGGTAFPLGEFLEVEIDPAAHRTVRLELDPLLFRGRLLYRDEPLQGALRLTPFPFDGRTKVQAKADAEGRFQIPLTEPGSYHVDVSSPRLTTQPRIPDVRFQDPEEEVTIVIPAGSILGRVLDADGNLVDSADVKAKSLQATSRRAAPALADVKTGTDEDGTFSLEGLGTGRWTVTARLGEQESEPHTLEILTAGAEEFVELILRPSEKIRGTVVDGAGQPLAGVAGSVIFQPQQAGELTTPATWTSGADGGFDLEVGAQAGTTANFVLVAPERPATAIRTALADHLTLGIPAAGGEVRLKRLAGPWHELFNRSFPYVLIAEDGAFVSAKLGGRAQTSNQQPDVLRLPNLAPGKWNLVALSSIADRNLLVAGAGNSLRSLATFEVVPHQIVEAVVP